MKQLLLFLLMIIAAVFCGLVIAYFYLRRIADERQRLRREPRVMPFPDKHPPVDVTPTTPPSLPQQEREATGTPDAAERDAAERNKTNIVTLKSLCYNICCCSSCCFNKASSSAMPFMRISFGAIFSQ